MTAHTIFTSDNCEAHSRQNSILSEKQQEKRIYNKRYRDKMKTLKAPFTVNQQKQISQDKRKIHNKTYYQKKKMAKNKCTSEENKHSSVENEHSDNIENKETPTFCTPDRNLHQTNNTSAAPHHTGLFDNEQSWENIRKFHQSMKMKIFQCNVCKEAWPLNKYSHDGTTDYMCCRCKRDKGIQKNLALPIQ